MEILCQNLTVGYDNNPLHSNINFSIPSGSYTCIIGDNGVGKSTLIKTMLGLLPPISGDVIFGGGERAEIGYLPQQTQVQKDFPACVNEVVLSGCLNKIGLRPFYNRAEKQRARDMMQKLGIAQLAKKSYSKLSGGQQQRVLLARALVATDKILLLDEPTAGLDIASTTEFYRIIKDLNKEGTTIIMITHNLQDAISDADYILCLNNCGVNCLTKKAFEESTNA